MCTWPTFSIDVRCVHRASDIKAAAKELRGRKERLRARVYIRGRVYIRVTYPTHTDTHPTHIRHASDTHPTCICQVAEHVEFYVAAASSEVSLVVLTNPNCNPNRNPNPNANRNRNRNANRNRNRKPNPNPNPNCNPNPNSNPSSEFSSVVPTNHNLNRSPNFNLF